MGATPGTKSSCGTCRVIKWKKIAEMGLHTARIASLDWLPGGKHLISGSLDCKVIAWDLQDPTKPKGKSIDGVNGGGVTSVAACNEKSFASVGFDGFMTVHELE